MVGDQDLEPLQEDVKEATVGDQDQDKDQDLVQDLDLEQTQILDPDLPPGTEAQAEGATVDLENALVAMTGTNQSPLSMPPRKRRKLKAQLMQ